ncbi:hypothetical protein ACMGEE_04240 [Erwinia sp. DT-104]|uniref:hypothetical protein n=1 Tax=Erwinia sp. DT-104 TaxID=3396161 RepID=UPI003F1AAC99
MQPQNVCRKGKRYQARHQLTATLKAQIAEQRLHSSLWRRLLNLFISTDEQQAYSQLISSQAGMNEEKVDQLKEPENQRMLCDVRTKEWLQLQIVQNARLTELNARADGEIIGTVVSDFTLDTVLYPFEANRQQFAPCLPAVICAGIMHRQSWLEVSARQILSALIKIIQLINNNFQVNLLANNLFLPTHKAQTPSLVR